MKALFIASCIRTGHLDTPAWRAIRYALHRWQFGRASVFQVYRLLEAQGFNRLMATDICCQWDNQVRARDTFKSNPHDQYYDLPNIEPGLPAGHRESMPMLSGDVVGNGGTGNAAPDADTCPLQES